MIILIIDTDIYVCLVMKFHNYRKKIILTHDQLPIAFFTEMRVQKLKIPESQDSIYVIRLVFSSKHYTSTKYFFLW